MGSVADPPEAMRFPHFCKYTIIFKKYHKPGAKQENFIV